jgi:hypothetical protein
VFIEADHEITEQQIEQLNTKPIQIKIGDWIYELWNYGNHSYDWGIHHREEGYVGMTRKAFPNPKDAVNFLLNDIQEYVDEQEAWAGIPRDDTEEETQ